MEKIEVLRESTARGDVFEIPKQFGQYTLLRVIGCGGYAVVYEAKTDESNARLAAKVVRRPESNTDAMRVLERELRLSEAVSCPYLVGIHEVVYMKELIVLIMDYSEGLELMVIIVDNPERVVINWKDIFKQVCLGVKYLHERGLAHRDLKAENILVDGVMNCKLCDYGFICETRSGLAKTICGTVIYMSPEMILNKCYDPMASDVWSLGILLYVMLTGSVPWRSTSEIGLEQEIVKGFETDLSALSEIAKNIITRCCDQNTATRATIDQILDMLTTSGGVTNVPKPKLSSLPVTAVRGAYGFPTLQQPSRPNIAKVPSHALRVPGFPVMPRPRIVLKSHGPMVRNSRQWVKHGHDSRMPHESRKITPQSSH